ncbi:MAG: ABC transporter permease [Anaeroplasmataceae bacterium]
MRTILSILKKELRRVFTDKRMIISLLLPGIVIYFTYTLLGVVTNNQKGIDINTSFNVYAFNQPEELEKIFQSETNPLIINIYTEYIDLDEAKARLENKEIDLIINYEVDFYDNMVNFDPLVDEKAPNVDLYYNSSFLESDFIYKYCSGVLQSKFNKISINHSNNVFDLALASETTLSLMSLMMPFLLITLLFSGCMASTTESIAGEKERGTIATLLITPIKRTHLVLGKVAGLSIVSLVGSVASFIGLLLSLPNLYGSGIDISEVYSFGTYIAIFAVIISTVLLFTVILSIVSTFAKSIKEASQFAIPVMLIVVLIGMLSMFFNLSGNSFTYLIPVYNSVSCLSSLFSLSFDLSNFIITIIANFVYVVIGVYILTKMFNNEKFIFNK